MTGKSSNTQLLYCLFACMQSPYIRLSLAHSAPTVSNRDSMYFRGGNVPNHEEF